MAQLVCVSVAPFLPVFFLAAQPQLPLPLRLLLLTSQFVVGTRSLVSAMHPPFSMMRPLVSATLRIVVHKSRPLPKKVNKKNLGIFF
jgi:hypothetical protein